MGRRLRAAVAVLVPLLALGACGGDDAATTATTTTTTTAPSTTTTTAAPTTSAGPACPAVLEGVGNADQVDVVADLDGDGADDRVHSWRDAGEGAATWTVQVALAAGGGAVQTVPDDGVAGVAVIGGHDLDGDGTDELWARVGAGASARIVGLFHLDGCDLEPVTLGGNPVQLPVGGSVGTASGVACAAAPASSHLTVFDARTADGQEYAVTATTYTYADGALTEVGGSDTTATAGTPELDAATAFSCGTLAL